MYFQLREDADSDGRDAAASQPDIVQDNPTFGSFDSS